MQTIAQYHQFLTQKLASIGNPTAELDARVLICHFLQLDFTQFILQQNTIIDEAQLATLKIAETQALDHMPVSKILKSREFWGLDFVISEDVLDPRADSEILIETLLHFQPNLTKPLRVLDLGTGSGCLLLSLLSEYKNATGIGADFSDKALSIATQNAGNLGLANRTKFIQSDWFTNIEPQQFDIILSNPPYIPSTDIKSLDENVKLYDPISALDGGDDGLDPYHIIIKQAADYLKPNGILIFEMGFDQADGLFKILADHGFDSQSFKMPNRTHKNQQAPNGLAFDLGSNPRVIISKIKNNSNI